MGWSAIKVIEAIEKQVPWDASKSTIFQGDAGIVDLTHSDATKPLFQALLGDGPTARAYTAIYANRSPRAKLAGSSVNDVFWNPAKIFAITILHEAIHLAFTLDDNIMQQKLRVQKGHINDGLRVGGCLP